MVNSGSRPVRQFLLAFICLAVFWSFRTGVVSGFDHTVSFGAFGRLQWSLGAYITQLKGDARGYVTSHTVWQTLVDHGVTDDKEILARLGTSYPQNFADAGLLNRAIDAAIAARPDTDQLMIAPADDIGEVDFKWVAFTLFGNKISSLFFTYYVILGIGTATFALTFGREPAKLALAGVVLACQLLLFISNLYSLYGGSFLDERFLSVLAILPILHILIATNERMALSWSGLLALAIQSVLVVFMCSVRASVIWGVAALAVLVGGDLLWRRVMRSPMAIRKLLWPGLVLAVFFAAHSFYVSQTLNPLYTIHKGTTHHWLWHSELLALRNCPEWDAKYTSIYGSSVGDDLPRTVVRRYLDRHPLAHPEEYYEGADLTYQGYERLARAAVIDFVENDPGFFAQCFLYDRPLSFIRRLDRLVASTWHPQDPIFWIVVSYVCAVGLYFGFAPLLEYEDMARGAALLTFAFCMSSLPNLASDINPYVLGDSFLMLLCILAAWSAVLGGYALRRCLLLKDSVTLLLAKSALLLVKKK